MRSFMVVTVSTSATSLHVLTLEILVVESIIVAIRRQLGVVQRLVVVSDSLDVLGRINNIRIVR